MALNYVVSAQKPTVVSCAVIGSFTGPTDLNLVLAKTNRIELMHVTPDGLKYVREVPIFGRIATIKTFRARDEPIDSLLIMTAKYHLSIICWDKDGEVRVRASGHIADRVGRPSETGIIACVHSSGIMAFRLYDAVLKVVQWSEGKDLKGVNVRCEDLCIVDIIFLSDIERPIIAYVYQDQNGRHLKAAVLNLDDRELSPVLWKHDNIEAEATMIIPVPTPYAGCLVVGQESISYHKGGTDANAYCAIAPPLLHQAQINCYGSIDRNGQRFLLGDLLGRLFMLLLDLDDSPSGKAVKDIKLELLGETSIAECIAYLDNGVVFVGSRYGDSQLIRLTSEPLPDGTFVSIMENYVNLAPIRDMVVASTNGQQQVITCSGAFKDGTLRVIRNGIGIEELASVELPGIKALFSLHIDSDIDNYLVIGFLEETHILKINGEELEDTQLKGFSTLEQTLWAGCLKNGNVLQITCSGLILIKGEKVSRWIAPSRVSVAAVNSKSGQVAIACGSQLSYFKVKDSIKLVSEVVCENEISCIDISSIDASGESKLCAVGYWMDLSVGLRSLPELKELVREKNPENVLARSLLLIMFEGIVYLLVALGDGILRYYQIDMKTGSLTEAKNATIGTQPASLKKFISRDAENVFVCSDRPLVIYSSNQKLVFSNVNLRMVSQMTPVNSVAYQNSLVLTDGRALVIGKIDDIQKLHIRTFHLGESPSRIAYQPETNTIAVVVQRYEFVDANGVHHCRQSSSKTAVSFSTSSLTPASRCSPIADSEEVEISSILLLDSNTFETLHCHELGRHELALSIESCKLGEDKQPYYVVGTALAYADETEPKVGRILIFQVASGADSDKMRLLHEKETKGAAYSVKTVLGKLVVAINSSVRLFEWTADRELRLECSDFDNVTALYLKTKNDIVLVGDLMRSLSLLSYRPMESSFERIARDYVTNWMSACEIIDMDTFLGAENSYNLFTVMKDTTAIYKDEGMRLQEVGMYYLGELVNVFRHGSLIASHIDLAPPFSSPILYGTTDGGLGVIVQLPASFHKFLCDLQKRITNVTENCMRITHAQYRAFDTEKRSEASIGFVDGDLIESLMDVNQDKLIKIVKGLALPSVDGQESKNATPEDVLKLVEDLARIH